ncbi:MAG: hypothetical protein ACT4ON_15535 [Bacteroidota bacterium]
MSAKIIIKDTWNKLRFYFSFLLLAFYLLIAFLFLFSDIWADMIPKGRIVIGSILLVFAALRFYVAYRRYEHKKQVIKNIKQSAKSNIETQQHVTAE